MQKVGLSLWLSFIFPVHVVLFLVSPSMAQQTPMDSKKLESMIDKGKYQEVVDRLKQISSVKVAFPVLGRYDIAADLEAANGKELGKVILKVNRLAGVIFTETMPEVES